MTAKKKSSLPPEVIVYADGASRGNPGLASWGFLIVSGDGETFIEQSKSIGVQTNNYAEYTAVIEALKACARGGVRKITVRTDSQLLVRQMKGEYKVRSESIIVLNQKLTGLLSDFDSVKFEYVPREQNAQADRLANQALDSIPSKD